MSLSLDEFIKAEIDSEDIIEATFDDSMDDYVVESAIRQVTESTSYQLFNEPLD